MASSNQEGWLKYLSSIVKEIGLTGFIVIVWVFVFLFYGTKSQKQLAGKTLRSSD